MQVHKSDGSYEEYGREKVKSGIYAAYKKVKQPYDESIGNAICDNINVYDGISTDEIRQQVEPLLMNYSKKAASAYIKYGSSSAFVKDRVKYMDEYTESGDNAATASETDPNANVTSKNVANLDGEVYKAQNRKTQRYKMVSQLKKVYPEVAKDYIRDIDNHIIYVHDEASSPSIKNYCEAVTLYPLLIDGTKNMDGLNTTAPQNLNSFCGQLVNLTFLLAAQCKGAVAFGEFFNFFDYFCVKEFGEDYTEHLDEFADSPLVKKRKTVRERICQSFQQVVFGWNQPAGNRSFNSPFTNISYYCSNYWHALFDEFYFPDGTQPKWERVDVLQKMFMNWFCETRNKTLLTFPVETMALLTDGTDVVDKDYKDFTNEMWAKGHSFFLYLSDRPDSLASCCFEGDEQIAVTTENGNFIMTLKDFVDMNDPEISETGNKEMKCKAYVAGFDLSTGEDVMTEVTGTLKKKYTGNMYDICVDNGEIVVTADHILYVQNKTTGEKSEIPVGKIYANYKNYKIWKCNKRGLARFVNIKNINIEPVTDKIVYDIELKDKHYFSANNIITHNCRVKNKINSNTFSFTNGLTGVQTGSVNVITLNINRIIQNYFRSIGDTVVSPKKREYKTDGFEQYFRSIVNRVIKYQRAYKDLVYNVEKKGLLTASKAGYITMNKLYSTIGFNGFNEAAEFVGLTCNYNDEYKNFAHYITYLISDEEDKNQLKNKQLNLEMPPAEGLSSKNYNWDKADGYWVPKSRVLYNSYFYLAEDPDTTVIDKLKLHGKDFTQFLSGGVGCHINLDSHLSKEQYEHLMMTAIKYGTSYYTFNIPNCSCDKCGHIEKVHFDVCPECGSTETTDWTRVIGYLRPVSSFEKNRRIEASRRIYSHYPEV